MDDGRRKDRPAVMDRRGFVALGLGSTAAALAPRTGAAGWARRADFSKIEVRGARASESALSDL